MKIPGITNEVVFIVHKQVWGALKKAIDEVVDCGMEIENIDVTSNRTDFDDDREFTIRLNLVRTKDKGIE